MKLELHWYRTPSGSVPVDDWIAGLRDRVARKQVVVRLARLGAGLRGDWRSVGSGVYELRIDVGPGYRLYFAQHGPTALRSYCCYVVVTSELNASTSRELMPTGKTTRLFSPSVPFRVGDLLHSEEEIAAFLEEILSDGDPRDVPIALRTAADAMGGMAKLAAKTGLSRETLYRTLSANGNPRLDTLGAILAAFGLRLSVMAIKPTRVRQRKSGKSAATKPLRPRSRRAKTT